MPLHEISSSAIGELLYDSTLAASAANFDIQNIPASYKHLHLFLQGRSDRAAQTLDTVILRANNDSGANYDTQQLQGVDVAVSTSETFGATSASLGEITAASSTADAAGMIFVLIPNYAGTTFHKTFFASCYDPKSGTSMTIVMNGSRWASTSAINRLTVISGTASNFIAGTRVTLYGMN